MCGIAGFSLSPEEQVNTKRLAKSLLLSIEHRGPHATGFAVREANGSFQVHKRDVTASLFVKRGLCIPRNAKTAIMHTRFATQGAPEFNGNNHPILSGTVVGVHNGHITNDDQLFADVEKAVGKDVRRAVVDSEAVFAMLGWLDAPKPETLLEDVIGGAAVAWMDQLDDEQDTLHLARISSSPLWVGETEGGSTLFASTEDAVKEAAAACGMELRRLRWMEEGKYLRVIQGRIEDVRTFEPHWQNDWSNYSSRGTRTTTTYPRGRTMTVIGNPRSLASEIFGVDEDEFTWGSEMHEERTASGLIVKRDEQNQVTSVRWADEEPDVMDGDAELPDELRYQEWLRHNGAALDAAIAADEPDPMPVPYIPGILIVDPESEVPAYNKYLARTVDREKAIERWMDGMKADTDTAVQVWKEFKGDAMPGDTVETTMYGAPVFGEIVTCPGEFPAGDYILRVLVPNGRRRYMHEAVLISRKYHEFFITDMPKNLIEDVKDALDLNV